MKFTVFKAPGLSTLKKQTQEVVKLKWKALSSEFMFIPHRVHEHYRELKKKKKVFTTTWLWNLWRTKSWATLTLAFFPEGKETVVTAAREGSTRGCHHSLQKLTRGFALSAPFLDPPFLATSTNQGSSLHWQFLATWQRGETAATPLPQCSNYYLPLQQPSHPLTSASLDYVIQISDRSSFHRQDLAALYWFSHVIWSQDIGAIT